MKLQEFINEHGYTFQPEQLDSEFHEFTDSKNNKGWYIGHETPSGKITFTFGNWRRGERFSFHDETLTTQDREEIENENKKFIQKKTQRQLQAAEICTGLFNRFQKLGSDGVSKYLERKRLNTIRIPGTVVKPADAGHGHVLVVPLYDEHGVLWNMQTIYDDGTKQFFNFGKIEGCFFELPESEPGKWPTYVCEGFATGASIWSATGARVIVAFTLHNLKHVLPKFPGAVLACDFDGGTFKKMKDAGNKDPRNPGLDVAYELHQELGCSVVCPVPVTEARSRYDNVDFSDIFMSTGIEGILMRLTLSVSSWDGGTINPYYLISETSSSSGSQDSSDNFDSSSEPPPREEPSFDKTEGTKEHHKLNGGMAMGLKPFKIRYTNKGKPVTPADSEVAEHLVAYFGEDLVKCENDLFYYNGTHWQIFSQTEHDMLTKGVKRALGDYVSASKTRAVISLLSGYIPRAGANLFTPNPYATNFADGTLHVSTTYQKMKWEFKPHNKLDYVTHTIPFKFGEDRLLRNEDFETMVNKICGNDADKIRAIKQMYGACLAPIFPHLFMLVGKANSGKSSLIIPALKLLSSKNLSNVGPSEFEGFGMEAMIGKLVNFDLDVDTTKEISDATIKKIEDRVPININRKFKTSVLAPLPAVHIFGGNKMPRTRELGSGAHNRRWTFVPLQTFDAGENYIRDYASEVFNRCPQGVINFALEGLEDLLSSNGIYFNPPMGKELLAQWQRESDMVGSFLFECQDGGALCNKSVRVLRTEDSADRIERSELWDLFVGWHQEACGRRPYFSKTVFYNEIRGRTQGQNREIKVEGFYFFDRFRVAPYDDAVRPRGTEESGGKSMPWSF